MVALFDSINLNAHAMQTPQGMLDPIKDEKDYLKWKKIYENFNSFPSFIFKLSLNRA